MHLLTPPSEPQRPCVSKSAADGGNPPWIFVESLPDLDERGMAAFGDALTQLLGQGSMPVPRERLSEMVVVDKFDVRGTGRHG